jgi:sortase A
MMKARFSQFLVRSHYVLLFAGISVFGYCAIVWSTARLYQAQSRELLLRSNAHLATASLPPGPMPNLPSVALRAQRSFAVLGRVDVPRIQLSAMIAEGADSRALRVAVGHVPGTALPWQSGNVALVAHRDTFFRRIGELTIGDFIRLTVPGHEYIYRVTFTDIVNPTETWVLQPATGDTLTLATCYPFNFIGAAPKRFVVRARRLDFVPSVRDTLTTPSDYGAN